MSEDRWSALSNKYAEYCDALSNDTMRAAVLAKVFRAQLEKYLGGRDGSVLMFNYEQGTESQPDKYTEESDPCRAVSYDQGYNWFLGYGVTLERAPDIWPKTNFQFPVYFTLGDPLGVDTSFGRVSITVIDKIDLTPACELVFGGLREALQKRTNKTIGGNRIGFLEFKTAAPHS